MGKVSLFYRMSSLRKAEDGAAAVEFALVASMLVLLATGIGAFGIGLWQNMQVGNAASAGALDAVVHGYDVASIGTAVTSTTSLTTIRAQNITSSCGCPGSTGITTATCGASCADGGTAGTYVTVSAQSTYVFPIPVPGFTGPSRSR